MFMVFVLYVCLLEDLNSWWPWKLCISWYVMVYACLCIMLLVVRLCSVALEADSWWPWKLCISLYVMCYVCLVVNFVVLLFVSVRLLWKQTPGGRGNCVLVYMSCCMFVYLLVLVCCCSFLFFCFGSKLCMYTYIYIYV